MKTKRNGRYFAPTALLEALELRFGAFQAIAYAALELARKDPEGELPMDRMTAEAILEFGCDLRQASRAAEKWARQAREGSTLRRPPAQTEVEPTAE